MALKSSEVAKWKASEWQGHVKHVLPSKGGAVGVMFCWTRNPGSSGPDYSKPATADFVIKPFSGSAAPTKFAESFLQRAIGASTVHTRPITKTNDHQKFQAILQVLSYFKGKLESSEKEDGSFSMTAEQLPQNRPGNRYARVAVRTNRYTMGARDKEILARWREVWPNYSGADGFLVQEMAADITELADEYKETGSGRGIRAVLCNKRLMYNLGRLFAADAVLGNGDRLCNMNTGNILFNRGTGGVWAIDSETILSNYHKCIALKNFDTGQFEQLAPANPQAWAESIATNALTKVPDVSKGVPRKSAVLPPDFTLKHFYDLDRWWDKTFRFSLESDFSVKHGLVSTDPPLPGEWEDARRDFRRGVEDGLREVDRQLSGLNWLAVKNKFARYAKQYGDDPNLDWTNFKLRRIYIKAFRRGLNQEQALQAVKDYADRKLNVNANAI